MGSRKARGRLYRLRRREDRARLWRRTLDLLDQSERRAKSLRSGNTQRETCLRPRKPVFLAPSPHSPSRDTSVEPSTLERHPVLGRLDHHDPDRARARARSVLARRRAPSRVFPRLFPARARAGLVRARRGRGRGRRHPGARERRRFRSTSGRSPRLLSSVFDADAGLRVDRYVKPLGALRPGEVLNTDPTSDAGALARPVSNETDPSPMLVARFSFDLVHGETLEPLPLDRLNTPHIVIFSRPARRGEKKKTNNKNASPRASGLAMPRGPDDPAGLRRRRRARREPDRREPERRARAVRRGRVFAGGGAEWRGLRDRGEREKRGGSSSNRGATPPGSAARARGSTRRPPRGAPTCTRSTCAACGRSGTAWCNCAAYAERTPARRSAATTRRDAGGIECCGDGARGPLRMGNDSLNDESSRPWRYCTRSPGRHSGTRSRFSRRPRTSVTRFPRPTRALRRGAPMTATLMVSSSPDLDGASCAGEYDVGRAPARSLRKIRKRRRRRKRRRKRRTPPTDSPPIRSS